MYINNETMSPLYQAAITIFLLMSCSGKDLLERTYEPTPTCDNLNVTYEGEMGCDGQRYPDPNVSEYILPIKPGQSYVTGLTNCSASYHSAGLPDQYAFDFDMPQGTEFVAARDGIVAAVDEDEPSGGGGAGNYVLIDHKDGTYAYYLHSPLNGIYVNVGDPVKKGQVLGISGESGLAGYPHLHFIVVLSPARWPYRSIPVSFNNAIPTDVILRTGKLYKACENYR